MPRCVYVNLSENRHLPQCLPSKNSEAVSPWRSHIAYISRTLLQGRGGAEERIACPRGAGETPAMGSIKRGRVMPPATGYKRAWSPSWKIAARRLPPEAICWCADGENTEFVKEPNQHECFCSCTNGASFPFSCQCPREDLRETMEVLRAALHPSVAHRPGAHGLWPAVPSRRAGVAGRHLSAVSGLDPL
jgi:hypothetical protein